MENTENLLLTWFSSHVSTQKEYSHPNFYALQLSLLEYAHLLITKYFIPNALPKLSCNSRHQCPNVHKKNKYNAFIKQYFSLALLHGMSLSHVCVPPLSHLPALAGHNTCGLLDQKVSVHWSLESIVSLPVASKSIWTRCYNCPTGLAKTVVQNRQLVAHCSICHKAHTKRKHCSLILELYKPGC